MFGFKKTYTSKPKAEIGKQEHAKRATVKPKASHPWKQAAFVATEAKREVKRSERDWRDSIIAHRDRMGVRA